MSITRLCVRISTVSRAFLSTCGERSTQYLFLIVGSGIGPATCAPVRFAVSTISPVEVSSTRSSYAFSRSRILCPTMCCRLPRELCDSYHRRDQIKLLPKGQFSESKDQLFTDPCSLFPALKR